MARHGGAKANGKGLVVTYEQLRQWGIRKDTIAPAIREVCALGFVAVVEQGRGGNREYRKPSTYRLTYRWADDKPPTHEWRRFKDSEDAEAVAKAARYSPTKNRNRPPFRGAKPPPVLGGETANFPPPVLGVTKPTPDLGVPYIYISGERSSDLSCKGTDHPTAYVGAKRENLRHQAQANQTKENLSKSEPSDGEHPRELSRGRRHGRGVNR
jgi:hypothetical protein